LGRISVARSPPPRSGTNTRHVRGALGALWGSAVGKDTVSRVWRKVQSDWDAWNARLLADEPIVRLILDARWRDRKATTISLLVVIGVTNHFPGGTTTSHREEGDHG
jgi:hypothetical protein